MAQLYVQKLNEAFTPDDYGKVIVDNDGRQAILIRMATGRLAWLRVYEPPTRWQRFCTWWKQHIEAISRGTRSMMLGGFLVYNGIHAGALGVLVVLLAYGLVYGFAYSIGRKK